jgi:hypothetical protein
MKIPLAVLLPIQKPMQKNLNFFLTLIPSGLMYTLTLKAIQSLAEIRFRVITAGLAFYAFARSVNN